MKKYLWNLIIMACFMTQMLYGATIIDTNDQIFSGKVTISGLLITSNYQSEVTASNAWDWILINSNGVAYVFSRTNAWDYIAIYGLTNGSAGTWTNLSQYSNDIGFLTNYSDTLQSVMNRGSVFVASSTNVAFDRLNTGTNTYGGKLLILGDSIRSGGGNSLAILSGGGNTASFVGGVSSSSSNQVNFVYGLACIAIGGYDFAIGEGAQALHDHAFVWSDGNTKQSSTNREFTVYARGGIRLDGGDITANGNAVLTNLTPVGIGYGTIPSTTSLIANAGEYNVCDIALTNDATIGMPTNAPYNGKKMQFRLYADGADRNITLSSDLKIPSSSLMSNNFVVVSNTTSLLLIDYYAARTNWFVESYVWGY